MTSRTSHKPKQILSCRAMVEGDIEPAILLLSAGFPEREPDYWRRALERLRDRSVPAGFPRYGHVMTDRGRLVGIILIIFSATDAGKIRGNVSSWYVEEPYRGLSNLLLATPLKMANVTLVNISPRPTTLAAIKVQGFSKYVGGSFQAVAAVAPRVKGVRVRRISAGVPTSLPILADHAAWDCLSFEVSYAGEIHPFIFTPSRFVGEKLPCAQLVYCRDVRDFVRFAGPLGRRLLRHGLPAVTVDADGPLAGLTGVYRAGRGLRFYSGATCPRIGDLSYSELPMFGA